MEILVGYTGFVGTNLAAAHKFDKLYNSKNIGESFGTKPDLLVYSGVPAAMFLANNDPKADMEIIKNAAENIRKINPKRLVHVSTVAVLDNPVGTDESAIISKEKLTPYGYNRLYLEEMVKDIVEECHIIRLPALFGKNLKKNFINDIKKFFPPMLNTEKFNEFSEKEPVISKHYKDADNGFYTLDGDGNAELRAAFERLNFSALSFTDSRSVFQFYNLSRLWNDIETAIKNNIPLLHTATEPTSAAEVYEYLTGKPFINETAKAFNYDYRTKYAEIFGGENGYISDKQTILQEIKNFLNK